MSGVIVTLLGKFRVETEEGKICFPTRKAESLLACLILHPEGIRRDYLAGLLWPDVEDELARRNLRTTLWRLKRTINGSAGIRLQSIDGKVGLLRAGVEVDLFRFKELLREAHEAREGRPEMLKLAESIYEGDLLEDRLEEWCEEERLSLRTAYVTLLRELTEISKAGGDIAKALEYARRVVKIEPLDEDARRELMILLHLAGKRAEALAQFEALRQLLKAELGVAPSQATLQAWLHIRSHRNLEISISSEVADSDSGKTSADFDSMPLVGRADLASGVLRAIEARLGSARQNLLSSLLRRVLSGGSRYFTGSALTSRIPVRIKYLSRLYGGGYASLFRPKGLRRL